MFFYYSCRDVLSYSAILDNRQSKCVPTETIIIWPLCIRPTSTAHTVGSIDSFYFHLFFFFPFFLSERTSEPYIRYWPRNGMMESVAFFLSVSFSLFYNKKCLWGEFTCLAFRFNLLLLKYASASLVLLLFFPISITSLASFMLYTLYTEGYDVRTIILCSHSPSRTTLLNNAISAGSFLWGQSGLQHNAAFCWHLNGKDYGGYKISSRVVATPRLPT